MEHENVTVVQRVPDLEGINCIGLSILDDLVDLLWCHSVVIHAIIELNISQEVHTLSRNQEVTLSKDSFNFWVSLAEGAENASRNLFFPICENHRFLNDSEQLIR